MEDSDLALVRAVQAGDDRAFDELLRRHTDALYRFVRRYVESDADAEDLTQEAFCSRLFWSAQFQFESKISNVAVPHCAQSLHRLFAPPPLSQRPKNIFDRRTRYIETNGTFGINRSFPRTGGDRA